MRDLQKGKAEPRPWMPYIWAAMKVGESRYEFMNLESAISSLIQFAWVHCVFDTEYMVTPTTVTEPPGKVRRVGYWTIIKRVR